MSELRLRRADLDAFERSLARQRWLGAVVLAAIGVAIAAAAAWWLWLRPHAPHTSEVEPNDDDAHATRIAPNTDVTGYLGKRISPSQPDVDVYRVPWPDESSHIVTVRVSGLPNLDVALAIRDKRGQQIAAADENGIGGGEVLLRWEIQGPLYVEVSEAMHDQRWPIENVSDPYTVSVTVNDPDPGWETEPNGNAPDATPLQPASAVRGWLEARGELDLLRWDGDPGAVKVEVDADKSLPMQWRGPDGAPHPPGTPVTLTLAHGDILRLERTDRDASHDHALPGIDAAWTVTATPLK